jgi:Putative phage holin Dp-1
VSSRVYDFLKFLALVALPAVGTLYFALAGIWHLPYAEEVVGTVTAVDTALGLLINRASKNNVVGDLVFSQDRDGTVTGIDMEATKDPFVLQDENKVVFQVKRRTTVK